MLDDIKELIKEKGLDLADYNQDYDLRDDLDYDGSLHELIDGYIDLYNYDLRVWAVNNYQYVEDAISEGLVDGTDYHISIQSGQYLYYREQADEAIRELLNEYQSSTIEPE